MTMKTNEGVNPARGSDAIEFLEEICTPEELSASEMTAQIVATLIEARTRKGLTQKALAERCGLPQPSLARIESGSSTPRIDTLCRVARALDLVPCLRPKGVWVSIGNSVFGRGLPAQGRPSAKRQMGVSA